MGVWPGADELIELMIELPSEREREREAPGRSRVEHIGAREDRTPPIKFPLAPCELRRKSSE